MFVLLVSQGRFKCGVFIRHDYSVVGFLVVANTTTKFLVLVHHTKMQENEENEILRQLLNDHSNLMKNVDDIAKRNYDTKKSPKKVETDNKRATKPLVQELNDNSTKSKSTQTKPSKNDVNSKDTTKEQPTFRLLEQSKENLSIQFSFPSDLKLVGAIFILLVLKQTNFDSVKKSCRQNSSNDLNLEIGQDDILLTHKQNLFAPICLNLPQMVNEDKTKAQFDKSTSKLLIQLKRLQTENDNSKTQTEKETNEKNTKEAKTSNEIISKHEKVGVHQQSVDKTAINTTPAPETLPFSESRVSETVIAKPPFKYRQDLEFVVLVVDVKQIDDENLKVLFFENFVFLRFSQKQPQQEMKVYELALFPFANVNTENCSWNLSTQNLVIRLQKKEKVLWKSLEK